MQPNQYYYQAPNPRLRTLRRLGVILLTVIVLIWLGVFIYRQVVFRVSKTDPNMNHVSASSAFINVYFNKPIDSASLRMHYSSGFVAKSTIKDKEVDLALKTNGLTIGGHYTIYLDYVASKTGKEIRSKKLNFVAKNIPASSLSKAQQQALINQQDQYPYEVQNINFANFNTLLNSGLSADQLDNLKQDLFGYSNQVNQKFWTMTLQPKTLVVQIHNAESASLDDNYSFQVVFGGSTYNVQVVSDPINDTVQVQLLDANNNLVYDSENAHD